MGRRALLYGATGLVGRELLLLLLNSPEVDAVIAPVRRPLSLAHQKLAAPLVEFDDPAALAALPPADDVFCCLGTTIRKAGSQAAFRTVDHDYPLAAARAARAAGAKQFLVVTAVGADAKSGVFYSRVKGELEQALAGLAFPGGVKVFHPSLLMGDRAERRPAEAIAMGLMSATAGLFVGPLKKYRAIEGAGVARGLLRAALHEPEGNAVYEGESLFALARK